MEGKIMRQQKLNSLMLWGLVVLLLGYVGGLMLPSVVAYQQQSTHLNRFELVLDERLKQEQEEEALHEALSELQLLLEEKKKRFFSNEEAKAFAITELAGLLDAENVYLERIDFQDYVVVDDHYKAFPISLELKSNFLEFMNFMALLDTHDKTVAVKRFVIETYESKRYSLTIGLQLLLYVKEPS